MIRRLTVSLAAGLGVVALTVALATGAGAQQYPPTGSSTTTTTSPGDVLGTGVNAGHRGTTSGAVLGADADRGQGGSGSGSGSSAPLVRTGMDLAPLVLLGAALVASGAFWLVSARRVRGARGAA